ncbi:MAG: beta-propeller fold lactonase family protein, partial [bacterium]
MDPQTGALTQVAATPAGDRPECLSFDFTGRLLYVTVGQGAEVEIFRVEPTTGALLREDSLRTRASPLSIAIVPGETPLEPRASYAYVATAQSAAPAVFR